MPPAPIIINTGDLLSSDAFKRRVILLPALEVMRKERLLTCSNFSLLDQVIAGVELTLQTWRQRPEDCSETQANGTLVIQNLPLVRKLDPDVRSGLKVTVKIFTYSESCAVFTNAVNFLMSSLGIDYIDILTLALPPTRKKSIEEMKSIWTCAVTNVITGKIRELGVSDLDAGQLEELYAWAEEVKPSTNQINLETCCVIPPELNEFAKLKNIRLLTHNDSRDMLPTEKLTSLLSDAEIPHAADYRCLWIGRYSVLVTANGVIDSKGFIVAVA